MKICPKCRWTLESSDLECGRCGIVVAKYLQLRHRPGQRHHRSKSKRVQTPRPTAKRLSVLPVAALAILVMVVVIALQPERFPSEQLIPSSSNLGRSDPCGGRERCVVVYLTPWCPSCDRSLELIGELSEMFSERTDVGFRVIIGQDEPELVEAMAANISAATFVDSDGSLWDRMGSTGVPHWYSLDRTGRVLDSFGGTYRPLHYHLEQLDLR